MKNQRNFQSALGAIGAFSAGLLTRRWAMPADLLRDTSGAAGAAGAAGAPGADGRSATDATLQRRRLEGDAGEPGSFGDDGENGGDGADGSAISVATEAPVLGSIVLGASGGAGGNGGAGGDGGAGGRGGDALSTYEGLAVGGGRGGKGGAGGAAGAGGNGGAAASIGLVVDHPVAGNIVLSAIGGAAGRGGPGGVGGMGGSGGAAYARNAAAQLGTAGETGASQPMGADGEAGMGGSIIVALNASVGGNCSLDAGSGTIRVSLNDGASVGGTIAAHSAASVLRFAMPVADAAEHAAARAYLADPAHAAAGTLELNGRVFAWRGFGQLIDALTLDPAAAVRVDGRNIHSFTGHGPADVGPTESSF